MSVWNGGGATPFRRFIVLPLRRIGASVRRRPWCIAVAAKQVVACDGADTNCRRPALRSPIQQKNGLPLSRTASDVCVKPLITKPEARENIQWTGKTAHSTIWCGCSGGFLDVVIL